MVFLKLSRIINKYYEIFFIFFHKIYLIFALYLRKSRYQSGLLVKNFNYIYNIYFYKLYLASKY